MSVINWLRFLAGAAFLLCGVFIFLVQIIGVFKFKYVMNRMHAAAMGDTLGIGSALLGLMFLSGLNFTTLKLAFVIVFLWFSSPVSSHVIARLEILTDETPKEHYKKMDMKKEEA